MTVVREFSIQPIALTYGASEINSINSSRTDLDAASFGYGIIEMITIA
jgi:hypothetical protein